MDGRTASAAANDWAAKRKLAMERAAQLRAERQATMRERRPPSRDHQLEGADFEEAPSSRGRGAEGSAGPRRTASQPTSDLPVYNHHAYLQQPELPMRPNSEAAGSDALPEWARDFSASRLDRVSRAAAAAESRRGGGGGFAPTGADYDYEVPYPEHSSPPPHEVDVHAAAAKWSNDLPLGQSDGGIGYHRGRAMPRGPSSLDDPVRRLAFPWRRREEAARSRLCVSVCTCSLQHAPRRPCPCAADERG